MSITAMKQALEALEDPIAFAKGHAAKAALHTAIAEAEKQEPVAWMVYTLDGKSVCVTDNPSDFTDEHRALPLYTTPPAAQRQWVGLTDKQINQYDYEYRDILYDAEKMLKENNA